MVRICSVYRCNSQYVEGGKVSFHAFPADSIRRNIWITAVNQAQKINFVPTKCSYLCSKHFSVDSFNSFGGVKRSLKRDAVPTIFNSDSDLHKSAQKKLKFDQNNEPSTSFHNQQRESSASAVEAMPEEILNTKRIQLHENTDSDANVGILDHNQQRDTDVESNSSTITAESNNPIIFTSVDSTSSASPMKKKHSKTSKRRPWNPRYVGDCGSSDMSSPNKARRNWRIAKQQLTIQKKRIQYLSASNRRLKLKVTNLNTLLKHLKDNNLISTENAEINIMASLPNSSRELFKRMLTGPSRQKYSAELRNFAITLNFYSRKAYDYVRKQFNNTLPHPHTITRWFRAVDGSPGFTTEAINALKIKVLEAKNENKQILCHLVMDEMAIRRQVEWTGTKFTGLVGGQCGIMDVDSDELQEAKEVLVFMLVAINSHWKIPVGYFLLNGLSGAEKANLVQLCLEFVHESGVIVTSLTFDGAASNMAMVKHLGANITDMENMTVSFLHPVTEEPVFVIPDACHMLKLLRNCLASQQVIKDGEDQHIKWEYFKQLVRLQEEEGLHAGTKIRRRHMEWYREKMKVFLASQTFSNSVANALEFCAHDLKLDNFRGAEATIRFCRIVNDVFDIFNSKNLLSKTYFKKALSPLNYREIFHHLNMCKNYFMSLKTFEGTLLIHSGRKMGFIGFIVGMESLRQFYLKYVDIKEPLLTFVLTYKFSQDHLEIFFSAVRSRGGNNNNPTARQFEATYKRLIVHAEIKGSENANCIALDNTTILNVTSRTITKNQETGEDLCTETMILEDVSDVNFCSSRAWDLTCYQDNVVTYMAGFIVKKLKNCIVCGICRNALEKENINSNNFQLLIRKKYGNLQQASDFIVNVCRIAEKCLRHAKANGSIFKSNIKLVLINNALSNLPAGILDSLHDHILDQEPLNNHGTQILKLILDIYFKIRIHHETKINLEKTTNNRIRSMYTKTVLFKNQ